MLILSACAAEPQNEEKIRDLEYTVLDKADVPQEFLTVIEDKKDRPFRLTYADGGVLYIADGYGKREKTGYRVKVTELYETEDTICFHTNLMGPEKGVETKETATFPYVVVKLDDIEKEVVFDGGRGIWN